LKGPEGEKKDQKGVGGKRKRRPRLAFWFRSDHARQGLGATDGADDRCPSTTSQNRNLVAREKFSRGRPEQKARNNRDFSSLFCSPFACCRPFYAMARRVRGGPVGCGCSGWWRRLRCRAPLPGWSTSWATGFSDGSDDARRRPDGCMHVVARRCRVLWLPFLPSGSPHGRAYSGFGQLRTLLVGRRPLEPFCHPSPSRACSLSLAGGIFSSAGPTWPRRTSPSSRFGGGYPPSGGGRRWVARAGFFVL